MTIALTGPVAAFFDAETTGDLEALARCFGERATVRDEVAGAFPNSPLDLEHVFVVEGGRIVSLEIR